MKNWTGWLPDFFHGETTEMCPNWGLLVWQMLVLYSLYEPISLCPRVTSITLLTLTNTTPSPSPPSSLSTALNTPFITPQQGSSIYKWLANFSKRNFPNVKNFPNNKSIQKFPLKIILTIFPLCDCWKVASGWMFVLMKTPGVNLR